MPTELLTDQARILAGILVIALVTVESGGLYMVQVVSGRAGELTPFQVRFSRAGQARPGVLLILSIVAFVYAQATELSGFWSWLARAGVRLAAILMPAGFFFSSMGKGRDRPNGLVWLVYSGGVVLAASLLTLGIGLLTAG